MVRKKTTTSNTDQKTKDLTPSQKKLIKNMFESGIENVDKGDVEYVLKNTRRKFKKLPTGNKLKYFAKQVKLLFKLLQDAVKKRYKVPWKFIAAIVAALLYVINPLDVIPDYIPLVGYLDDAFIVVLCIKFIKSELLDYCQAKDIDPDEYGI
jgi:uncharacterized membrane protein YkvA (DUF1232 family)